MGASNDRTEELALADVLPGAGEARRTGGPSPARRSAPPPLPAGASSEGSAPQIAGLGTEAAPALPLGVDASHSTSPLGPPPLRRTPLPPRPEDTRSRTRPGTGRSSRNPVQRLWRVYWVTCQVSVSYLLLKVTSRLRTEESALRAEERAHRRNARRIKEAVVDLQGLFIKVGQLISIMANFLPEIFRKELEELQDKVPPRPYEDIEARLLEEYAGRGPDEVFAAFDRIPVASASIGQVHKARLATGEDVAVKVQYPDIEEIVRVDLRALKRIFWVLKRFLPDWGFDTTYREIREMVLSELDYRREAESMRRVAASFTGRKDVLFPEVMADYSTSRVLVTQWMPGTKVADLKALAAEGIDRQAVARLFVDAYCQQIFVDGFYHADPHPGNLLVQQRPDGSPAIIFLDFGATAHVSEGMRKGMINFLQGTMTRDSARLVSAMKEMGFISRKADPEVFDRVVEYFHDKLRAEVMVQGFSLKDIRFDAEQKLESLLDLRDMNVSLGDLRDAFHVPKDWVLLERALLLLLGVCTTLDPEMNPAQVIKPYLERFLLGKGQELADAAMDATREAALAALALPGEMRRWLAQANRGGSQVVVANLHEGARLVYAVGQQVMWAGLLATSAVVAVIFDGRGQEVPRRWATVAASLCGGMLVLALAAGRRAKTRR
ncbi:MAG: hypothetical protein KA712_05335 [Myxococcales bacterium]|nr:hypothetical protein [Myxococcales bacterium]